MLIALFIHITAVADSNVPFQEVNSRPEEYCNAYKNLDSPKNFTIHKSCIENSEVEINKDSVTNLTGFVKKGSASSYHYLATKGKKKFKEALRKLVVKRLFEERLDHLGMYKGVVSRFDEIQSCAEKLNLEKFNKPRFNNPPELKKRVYARAHLQEALVLKSYMTLASNL
jgi:hypothetical protein